MISIFFKGCGAHRDLHSFPTRRSSDLSPSTSSHSPARALPAPLAVGQSFWARQRFSPRSEEHTSELQSQSNLVCRLLLEKKKSHRLPKTCQVRPLPPRHSPCCSARPTR